MVFKTALVLIAAVLAVANASTRLDILLAGRSFPNMDIFNGAPDAYAIVYYAPTLSDTMSRMGVTQIRNDNNNPDWPEVFNYFLYGTANEQRIKVEIWDSDVDSDDFIGSVDLRLSEIVNAPGNQLEKTLSPSGNGRLSIKGRVNYTVASDAETDSRFWRPSRIISVPPTIHTLAYDPVH